MSLRRLRQQIDELDRRIVRLLNRRAQLSLAIGRRKAAAGMPLFHRRREREIARNVRHASRGPLPGRSVEHLFEQILRTTRAVVRAALRAERRARQQPRRGKL